MSSKYSVADHRKLLMCGLKYVKNMSELQHPTKSSSLSLPKMSGDPPWRDIPALLLFLIGFVHDQNNAPRPSSSAPMKNSAFVNITSIEFQSPVPPDKPYTTLATHDGMDSQVHESHHPYIRSSLETFRHPPVSLRV